MHNYSDYIETSKIAESIKVSDGVTAVKEILNSFQTVIMLQRELLSLSAEVGDEGNALRVDENVAGSKINQVEFCIP